mmetsp:Transcript_68340/g.193640  ORF Transcript_68340/g.193640 Transcript_68340/m.193640 type:complete len:228 (+) Transcript_68340:270-953(+)
MPAPPISSKIALAEHATCSATVPSSVGVLGPAGWSQLQSSSNSRQVMQSSEPAAKAAKARCVYMRPVYLSTSSLNWGGDVAAGGSDSHVPCCVDAPVSLTSAKPMRNLRKSSFSWCPVSSWKNCRSSFVCASEGSWNARLKQALNPSKPTRPSPFLSISLKTSICCLICFASTENTSFNAEKPTTPTSAGSFALAAASASCTSSTVFSVTGTRMASASCSCTLRANL